MAVQRIETKIRGKVLQQEQQNIQPNIYPAQSENIAQQKLTLISTSSMFHGIKTCRQTNKFSMTTRSEITEQYSALELTKGDLTADAPELDRAITAFELDGAVLAPQVIVHTGPEVVCNDTPPEALDKSEDNNDD